MSITVGDLVVKLRAENREVGPALKQVEGALKQVEATVKGVAVAAERSFIEISQDVKRAAADFAHSKISVEDYRTALNFAGREASQLAQRVKPTGVEIRAFDQVMHATGLHTKDMSHGIGMVRNSLGSLAFVTAGLPGVFGQLAATLSSFAFASLTTAGVFAGLAGLGMWWKHITKEANEAKKAQQDALDQLAKVGTTRIGELQALLGDARTGQEKRESELEQLQQRRSAELDRRTKETVDRFGEVRAAMEVGPVTTRWDVKIQKLSSELATGTIAIANAEREVEKLRAAQNALRDSSTSTAEAVTKVTTAVKSLADALRALDKTPAGLLEGRGMPSVGDVDAFRRRQEARARASQLMPFGPTLRPSTPTPDMARWTTGRKEPAGAFARATEDAREFFNSIGKGLQGLVDPKMIFSNFATGAAQALSGYVFGQLGDMFGGGGRREAAQRELAKVSRSNTEALKLVTSRLAALNQSLLSEKGGVITGFLAGFKAWVSNAKLPEGVRGGGLVGVLEHFGVTLEDVDRLAAQFGVTVRDANGNLIVSGLEALAEALQADWLRQITSTFTGAFDLLSQEIGLLDMKPAEKFQRAVDLAASLVSEGFAKQIRGLNASNIDQFIQNFLRMLRDGTLDMALLGQMSVQEFMEFLSFAEGSLDELADSANSASEALRNVPTGFKIALARFNATVGVPSTTTTGIPGSYGPTIASAQGVTISGPVTIVANDPQELYTRTMAEARRQRRRGGTSALDVSSQPMRFTGGP